RTGLKTDGFCPDGELVLRASLLGGALTPCFGTEVRLEARLRSRIVGMSGGKSRFRILPLTVQGITSPLGVHGQMRAPEMFNVCASPGPFRTDRATNPAPRRLLCRFIRPRRPIVAALSAYLTYLWLLAVPASALDPNT